MARLQIFISWSGEKSKGIAQALHKWLPEVLAHSEAWMSDTDILKGTDWRQKVKQSLEQSSIGVLCLTSENLAKPWILFEAGALALNQKSSLIIPYLIDVTSRDIVGPLDQFNAALANKEETKKLVEGINKALGDLALEDYKIRVLFNQGWPKLQKVLKKVTGDKDKETQNQSQIPNRIDIETLNRGKQPRKSAEKNLKKSQQLQTRHMKQYGFKAKSSMSTVKILDMNGTCNLRRSFEGITVRPGFKIESLPGALGLGNPNSRFIRYPRLDKAAKFTKRLSLVFQKKVSNECSFQIKIKGDLTSEDPELSFAYDSEVANGLLMTREGVEEAYKDDPFKYEYSSAEVDIPLDELTVEVAFPRGFKVEPRPGVFSRGGEILDALELNRIDSGFERQRNKSRLVVRDPLVEYTYLIYWMPPRANDVKASRKQPSRRPRRSKSKTKTNKS
jgi:hypothetical protein